MLSKVGEYPRSKMTKPSIETIWRVATLETDEVFNWADHPGQFGEYESMLALEYEVNPHTFSITTYIDLYGAVQQYETILVSNNYRRRGGAVITW